MQMNLPLHLEQKVDSDLRGSRVQAQLKTTDLEQTLTQSFIKHS